MMKLYELAGRDDAVRFSPYCWRIRMALAHKGLWAETIGWHFGEPGLPNGYKQVPVLVDDGEAIGDSTAIALHLEDSYQNGPSLFGGEVGLAHARFIVAWVDNVLQPALLPLVAPAVLKQVKSSAEAQFRAAREKRLGMSIEAAAQEQEMHLPAAQAALVPLRAALAGADFLGGDEPTYADYAVFGAFQWARCAGGPEMLAEDDPVYAWRERMLDLFDGLAREAETAPN